MTSASVNLFAAGLVGDPSCSVSDPSASGCNRSIIAPRYGDPNFGYVSGTGTASSSADYWSVTATSSVIGYLATIVASAQASAQVDDTLTFLGGSGDGTATFTFAFSRTYIYAASESATNELICFFGSCTTYGPGNSDALSGEIVIERAFQFGDPFLLSFGVSTFAHDYGDNSYGPSSASIQLTGISGAPVWTSASADVLATPEPACLLLLFSGLLVCKLLNARR